MGGGLVHLFADVPRYMCDQVSHICACMRGRLNTRLRPCRPSNAVLAPVMFLLAIKASTVQVHITHSLTHSHKVTSAPTHPDLDHTLTHAHAHTLPLPNELAWLHLTFCVDVKMLNAQLHTRSKHTKHIALHAHGKRTYGMVLYATKKLVVCRSLDLCHHGMPAALR